MSSGESGQSDLVFGVAEVRRVDLCPVKELHEIKAAVECGKCAYDAVRARLLSLHAALNDPWEDGGQFAPAFRPIISFAKCQDGAIRDLVRRDQLRIDLHWLACSDLTEERFGLTDPAERALWASFSEGIDAAEIDTFIANAPTTASMIREIGVDRPRQIYCNLVCEDSLIDNRTALRRERDLHLQTLQDRRREENARDQRGLARLDLPRLCDIWLAEELSRVIYDGRRLSHEVLRGLYISISPNPRGSRYAIANQRSQVDRYIRGIARQSRPRGLGASTLTVRRAVRESRAASGRLTTSAS